MPPMGDSPPDGTPFAPPPAGKKENQTGGNGRDAVGIGSAAMRDASVGAIELLESGELKRTARSDEGRASALRE